MKKSDIQETLVSLYLRLNGYFVSGFIVHSPSGNRAGNRTQVDALGIRLPYNSEPQREVKPSDYLQIPNGVADIVLCEVKGGHEPLQFNVALREDDAIRSVLRWVGAFEENEVEALAKTLKAILTPSHPDSPDTFRTIPSKDGRYQLRTMLFAPDRPEPRKNQTRYVHGAEIVGFINKCLRPPQARLHCSTRYDFGLWGGVYEPIVRIIKGTNHDVSLPEIYQALVNRDA